MGINIFKTQQELIISIALYFIKTVNDVIKDKGKVNIVLAGGNSPKKLYELLATNEYKNQIDWNKINFFFGDERYVPSDDSLSNYLMIQKSLFDPLKISGSQIFVIDTKLSPEEAAKNYSETITLHFSEGLYSDKHKPVSFDLMLLGLGDNSHTASLFPFTSILSETSATVKAVFLKDQGNYRITMSAPLINQSKHIAFLVYGKEKAEAVYHVLKDVRDTEKYPAQLIKPIEGELQWFLDASSASLIINFP